MRLRKSVTAGLAAGLLTLSMNGVVAGGPDLRADNTAPASRPFLVPVTVDSASVPGAAELARVEVSFDDGTTWRRVPVFAGKLLLVHPRQAGFVSLRATAVDAEGNPVEQTVIRAYEIR